MYKTIDEIPGDLQWLATHEHQWRDQIPNYINPSSTKLVIYRLDDSVRYCEVNSMDFKANTCYTRAQWQAARDVISGKPGWEDAPEWANWLAQDESGSWCFYPSKPERTKKMWRQDANITGIFVSKVASGKVLGYWRKTLEARPTDPPAPQYNPDSVAFKLEPFEPTKYHREIKPGVWVDVYDVLKAWRVENPALQHLIKKALQPGERGHKTLEQDLDDIISSAKRAKELESL